MMTGQSGRDCFLPLLPAGAMLFEGLPFDAIVIDALLPAVGDGAITVRGADGEGVLVIADGAVTDSAWCEGGVRSRGDTAQTLIRSRATSVSACRLPADAMTLVGPLIRAEPCYADLRLDWVVWPHLLTDLRDRGDVFVVELATPRGRGVTVIDSGRHIATYAEPHPTLGDLELLDEMVATSSGTIRVLIDRGAPAGTQAESAQAVPSNATDPSRERVEPVHEPTAYVDDDPNTALAAFFGPARDALGPLPSPSIVERSPQALTSVRAVLPQLKLLVQNRLQRSSEAVQGVVDVAASDGQSLEWLADRVRVMTVRGFLPSTFAQLADDMIALEGRPPS